MDKNSIIGFIIIALILFGFTFYESGQARKRAEQQRQLDSIALANMPVDTLADGVYADVVPTAEETPQAAPQAI